jgi:hypothetical protein
MKIKTSVWILLTCMMAVVAGNVNGQSAKTIRDKKIASLTVYEYFVEEGMDDPLVESIEKYDENGNLTEIKEFNNKGDLKRWETYSYNEEGKVVEEVFLDSKGRIESTEKSIYSDGLRVEKLYYNNKDKLVKRKVYEYVYRK